MNISKNKTYLSNRSARVLHWQIEDENLILIEGSVPGSKNSVVLLRDAIKYKTPEDAPFPAGLKSENKPKDVSSSNPDEEKVISSDIEGVEGEN